MILSGLKRLFVPTTILCAMVVQTSATATPLDTPEVRRACEGFVDLFMTGKRENLEEGLTQELLRLVQQQSGGTGVHPTLTRLGNVRNTTPRYYFGLPTGMLLHCDAEHAHGASRWEFGLNYQSRKLEYARFVPVTEGAPTSRPNPRSSFPTPSDASAACEMFPDLC